MNTNTDHMDFFNSRYTTSVNDIVDYFISHVEGSDSVLKTINKEPLVMVCYNPAFHRLQLLSHHTATCFHVQKGLGLLSEIRNLMCERLKVEAHMIERADAPIIFSFDGEFN